jgi:hypothetical protein
MLDDTEDHTVTILSLLAGAGVAIAILLLAMPAEARGIITCDRFGCSDRLTVTIAHQAAQHRSRHHRRAARQERPSPRVHRAVRGNTDGQYVTVPTAAGINITVAQKMVAPITGFIADLKARGYQPKKINCLNYSRSHVPGSLHFRGLACDFDQHGWGRTAPAMYRVADLVAKWGLRDGGEFRDWGHIDMGPHLRRGSRAASREAHPPFYGATAEYHQGLRTREIR